MEDTTRLATGRPCSTCGAPCAWAVTRTGTRIPLDPDPVDGGNVAVVEDLEGGLHARVVDPGSLGVLYRAHFASCPDAHHHRRRTTP